MSAGRTFLAAALLGALVLGGCGKYGPPRPSVPPPEPTAPAGAESEETLEPAAEFEESGDPLLQPPSEREDPDE